MWELKLTALALFLKQPGKLFRENKNLNASQLCKCWNIADLTQSPLAFINWAASRHALVHKMGSFLCRKMNTITY